MTRPVTRNTHATLALGLAVLLTPQLQTFGIDGDVDPSFTSPLFKVPLSLVSIEADGRVLYTVTEDLINVRLGRLNANGSPSATLDIGSGPQAITPPINLGSIHLPGATNAAEIRVLMPLPNGRILVGGTFTHFNGVARKLLVRLNPDGGVDPDFNAANAFAGDSIVALAPAGNGKIYAAGQPGKVGNSPRNVGIVRLDADGTLDATFVDSTISFGASVGEFSLQNDGKPLIVTAYANSAFQATLQLYRLGANGGLDSTFSQGVGTAAAPTAALHHHLLPNGQILMTGSTGTYNGATVNRALFRLNDDGSHDAAYPGVTLHLGNIGGLIGRFLPGPNGSAYFSGAFDKVNGQPRTGLARLKPDGTLDPNFIPGASILPSPTSIAVQSDGKIVAGASIIVGVETRYQIVRLNGSGGTPVVTAPRIQGLSIQPNGAIQMTLEGGTASARVDASADLVNWQPLTTAPVVNGTLSFIDTLAATLRTRFYRLQAIP